ncbi:hypothetical protein ACET3Z_001087 [Daucus carota]
MGRAFEESSRKVIIETDNLEAFGALDSNIRGCLKRLGAANDPGFAAQFMGEMGFQVVPQGQAQAEMEINDFILEDEIKDVSEDEAVVIME